jgi:hypothetical protein
LQREATSFASIKAGERGRREKIMALKLSELRKIMCKERERERERERGKYWKEVCFKDELTERERKWKWVKKKEDSFRSVQTAFRKLLLVCYKTTSFGIKMGKF